VTAADVSGLLARLEETHKAADTPGPWEAWSLGEIVRPCRCGIDGCTVPVGLIDDGDGDMARDDRVTAAIVAAHNAIGPLLAAVRGVLEVADSLDVDSCDPQPDDRSRLLFDTAQRLRTAVASALGAEVAGR
jgi:hypothetical protein